MSAQVVNLAEFRESRRTAEAAANDPDGNRGLSPWVAAAVLVWVVVPFLWLAWLIAR